MSAPSEGAAAGVADAVVATGVADAVVRENEVDEMQEDALGFDPIAYINTPRWQHSRLGLERIRVLLERMGRPQDRLRFVHVAGTNGKGSTCAYVESVLRCAGYRTGLFTSPYIECFEERIRVEGRNISLLDLTEVTTLVKAHAEALEAETGEHPTEFELMTAVALEHFARCACDIVILEVGLGGRLDSTNIIEAPEVCAITPLALDHTALLGDTLAQVAGEKAGIIKLGATVVSWPQEPEAMDVVLERAQACGCAVRVPDFAELRVEAVEATDWMRSFTYGARAFKTRLLGAYQPSNAAMAIEVIEALRERGWNVSDEALEQGIARTEWPGRFEVIAREPLTIVDGGHNPQGACVLASSLREVLAALQAAGAAEDVRVAEAPRVAFVMGVLADKDYEAMIAEVLPCGQAFFTYAPANPRALSAEGLAQAIAAQASAGAGADVGAIAQACFDVDEAMAAACAFAGERGVVVAFGSLYSIADIKKARRNDALPQ